jgi:hypothetical protein
MRNFARGAKLGWSRPTPHASPRRQRPPARMLRALRHHGAVVALASIRYRRGWSAGMLRASYHNVTRSPARRQPPRWGALGLRTTLPHRPARCHDGVRRLHHANAAMRRVPPGRHVLVSRDPSASAAMSHPKAPSMSCHLPPRTDTRSGISPACRTQ